MSNESNLSLYCAVAEAVIGARGFAYLLVLEIVVGSLAVLANAPLVVLVWRVSVFHCNLRLLLSQLSFGLLWYSVGYVVKAVSLLNHIARKTDPCHLVMDAYTCKCYELPFTIPISMTMYNLLAVNLERLYSTVLYRRYERDGAVPWLGCILAAMAWACSVGLIVSGAAKVTNGRWVGICENLLSMSVAAASRAFVMNSCLLVAGVVCCVIGYIWNKYRLRRAAINRAQHTLATRFQIDQNVKVNRVMMPSMFIVTLCYLPNYAFLSVVIAGLHLSTETQTWLIHVNYLWKLIYALAHAVISFKRNTYLRHRIGRVSPAWVASNPKRNQSDGVNEHQLHFCILEEAWRVSAKEAGLEDVKIGMKKASKVPFIPTAWRVTKRRRDRDATVCSTTTRF